RVAPRLPAADQIAPASAEEAAAALAGLTQAGRRVEIRNAFTHEGGSGVVRLSTANLAGIIDYAQADLYVTAGAGTALRQLQDFLAAHQMQAPLATPWPDATLGGLVATNLNAPLRMRYGSLRDNLIATTVALADGRVIRAGRNVVKNVAGYDLVKLLV